MNHSISRHRGIWLVSAVVVVAAIALVLALVYSYFIRLPHPSQANRQQLLRWLVERDLAQEPDDIQVALVDRLEEELAAGLEVSGQTGSLTADQRTRIQDNLRHLKRAWFRSRVERYQACQPTERMPFLEKQIAAVAQWAEIEASINTDGSGQNNASISAFFEDIDRWMEEEQGDRQQRMYSAVSDAVVAWLATRDLSEQSMETRRDLALRIAESLDYGRKADEVVGDLSESQQAQLLSNGELLVEAWLLDRANHFAKLPAEDRKEFVSAQIENVVKWNILEFFAPSDGSPASAMAGMGKFVLLTQTWVARAPDDMKPHLRELLASVMQAFLARSAKMPNSK